MASRGSQSERRDRLWRADHWALLATHRIRRYFFMTIALGVGLATGAALGILARRLWHRRRYGPWRSLAFGLWQAWTRSTSRSSRGRRPPHTREVTWRIRRGDEEPEGSSLRLVAVLSMMSGTRAACRWDLMVDS